MLWCVVEWVITFPWVSVKRFYLLLYPKAHRTLSSIKHVVQWCRLSVTYIFSMNEVKYTVEFVLTYISASLPEFYICHVLILVVTNWDIYCFTCYLCSFENKYFKLEQLSLYFNVSFFWTLLTLLVHVYPESGLQHIVFILKHWTL